MDFQDKLRKFLEGAKQTVSNAFQPAPLVSPSVTPPVQSAPQQSFGSRLLNGIRDAGRNFLNQPVPGFLQPVANTLDFIDAGANRVKNAIQTNPQQFNILSQQSMQKGIDSAKYLSDSPIKPLQFVGNIAGNTIKVGKAGIKGVGELGGFLGAGLVQAPVLAASGGKVNIPIYNDQQLNNISGGNFAQRLLKASGEGASKIVKGGFGLGQLATIINPAFQGLNAVASTPVDIGIENGPISPITGRPVNNDIVRRGAAGIIGGVTGLDDLAPNVMSHSTNTPLGPIDLAKGAGNLLGFTKNPTWNKILPATSKIIGMSNTGSKLLNFVVDRAIKGGSEGAIQGLASIPDNATREQKINEMAMNIALGAVAENAVGATSAGIDKVKEGVANIIRSLTTDIQQATPEVRQVIEKGLLKARGSNQYQTKYKSAKTPEIPTGKMVQVSDRIMRLEGYTPTYELGSRTRMSTANGFGLMAGVDVKKDESGKPVVSYDASKGAAGFLAMSLLKDNSSKIGELVRMAVNTDSPMISTDRIEKMVDYALGAKKTSTYLGNLKVLRNELGKAFDNIASRPNRETAPIINTIRQNLTRIDEAIGPKVNTEIGFKSAGQVMKENPQFKLPSTPAAPLPDTTVAELKKLTFDDAQIAKLTPEEAARVIKEQMPGFVYQSPADIAAAELERAQKIVPRSSTWSDSAKQRFEAKLTNAESPQSKAMVDSTFDKWIGQRQSATTKGLIEAQNFTGLPKNVGLDVIKGIEDPTFQTSGETKNIIDKLHQTFDKLYTQAADVGIDLNYRENYISHIWDKSSDEVKKLYASVRGKPGFSKDRVFPTYEEGIRMGLKPKYSDPSQILADYTSRINKAEADINFVSTLKKSGVLQPMSEVEMRPGWKPITGQGFPKASNGEIFYAPESIANNINNVFSSPDTGVVGKIAGRAAQVSKRLQEITLSGGMPQTPVNAFGLAQVQKELTAGRVVSPIKAMFADESFFKNNLPSIQKMQERNIPLSTSYDINSLVPRSFTERFFGKSLGEAWHKSIDDPTFKKFLPALQINLFNDIESQALKAKKSPSEAADIAAKAVKNFYGVISSDKEVARNKLSKDVMATGFFAPKYRESMVNFWFNNLKSALPVKIEGGKLGINNPLSLENKTNTKFVIGAIGTMIAMDKLNQIFMGHSMKDNPKGKEDKLLIPVAKLTGNENDTTVLGIPFMSSIATMPRTALKVGKNVISGDLPQAAKEASSLASTPIQIGGNIVKNEDYYGNQIYDVNSDRGQQLKDQGSFLLKSVNHPWIKSGMDVITNMKAGGDTSQKGVKPIYQIASEAMEMPTRFYKNGVKGSYYFDTRDAALKTADKNTQNDYSALHDGSNPVTVAIEGASLQDKMTKAAIRLNNPNVFFTERDIALKTAQKTGEPVDPLYTVDPATALRYIRYQSLGGSTLGSADAKALYKQYPDIGQLSQARSAFFTQNPIKTQTLTDNPAPRPSAYVQRQMDAKNWSDQQVKAFLDANTAFKNQQREILGLPPLDFGFSYNKKPKSFLNKVKFATPKLKGLKNKTIKLKRPKALSKQFKLSLKKSTTLKQPSYRSLSLNGKPLKLKVA